MNQVLQPQLSVRAG